MKTDTTLMHLMCAKICHDIAAPLGAVSLGLEMLADVPSAGGQGPTIDLIGYSTHAAIAKLEMFRCLTGFASTPQKPTGTDLERVLKNYWGDKKITLIWQVKDLEGLQGLSARLLLAVLLTAGDGIPRGGTLTIHPNLTITAEGPSALLHEEVILALTSQSPISAQTATTVVPFFAGLMAQNLGGQLRLEATQEDQFQIQRVGLKTD